MKCPICGAESEWFYVDINHTGDIIGCDDCLPPELENEDIVNLHQSELEEEYGEEDDVWYNIKEQEAVEEFYAARR